MKNPTNYEKNDFFFLKKTLLIMKISTFLLMINFLAVSAAGYAQNEKFTLKKTNATIKELLSTIEELSKVKFLYRDEVIENQFVSVDLKEASLVQVLDNILLNTGTTYRVLDNNLIVLAPKQVLQQHKITGTVTDGNSGESLPGVNVVVEGTTIGAVTNANGNYTLEVPENGVVIFSYVGYMTEKVQLAGQTRIDMKLMPDIKKLDEVVVVGYGTQRKSDITGSVTSVAKSRLTELPMTNFAQAIEGSVAGVNISQGSSIPGSTPTTSIRGDQFDHCQYQSFYGCGWNSFYRFLQ